MKTRDPLTGLELTEIGPTPPQRPMGFLTGPTVPVAPVKAKPAVLTPADVSEPGENQGKGFASTLMYALTGQPDATLAQTPEGRKELAARNRRRADAGQMAAQYKNPGRAHMQPVSGGSGNGLESIGKIVKLLGGLGL